ncbi:chaperone protein DnaK [Lachnospiraceae bacterium KM106-2]|nr:chaperone protein DnaK [Lachnospiraceae bacterium KM106-2]
MRNFYLGIDLGTTNSVVAYGNLTKSGALKCNVLELERKTENGGQARNKTLPSVVFYYKDPKSGVISPEVGDYAKSRYGTKLGYVSKSVKSLMGVTKDAQLSQEIKDRSPEEVSAQILRYMLSRTKKRLMEEELKDVIITIPASFDSDQCQATLDAANLAGINVENEHDILLYEPKAVIYDFLHMQESGEIPDSLISFEHPKNILVFDLGGGTLDVTIHKVGYAKEGMMHIEDLAISRYTKLGGDNFDELIANEMLKRFERQAGIKVPAKRKEEVMCKLRKMAERLKIEMSDDYDTAVSMEKELPEDYYKETYDMNLFDSYSYIDEFTLGMILNIVSPLMGNELTYRDARRIDLIPPKNMNNIIYPILDVLAKAGQGIKIDAVILNGGMTRFFPIKKRIDQFFGLESFITSDPDLSVARGAVYYHYCLHKYHIKKSSSDMTTILNDSLNIGVAGEYVSRLVEAGTRLPYVSPEITGKYTFSQEGNAMAIEIFLGRSKTKNLPNRRIADRIIRFSRSYPVNTPVSFRIRIDNLRLMQIEAWITGRPMEKALISVDTNGKNVDRMKSNASKLLTNEEMLLNAKGELNNLKTLVYRQNINKRRKGNQKEKINAIIERIKQACNKDDFYVLIMEELSKLSLNDCYRGYLYHISLLIAESWDDEKRKKMLLICKSHFAPCFYGFLKEHLVIKEALNYISKWSENSCEFIAKLMNSGQFIYYYSDMLESVVKYSNYNTLEGGSILTHMPVNLYHQQIMKQIYKKLKGDGACQFDLFQLIDRIMRYAREKNDSATYYTCLNIKELMGGQVSSHEKGTVNEAIRLSWLDWLEQP